MHSKKTQLIQQNIGGPLQATRIFNQEHADKVPLVLVPSSRAPCSFYYHIPSGVHTIVHNCGDDAFPESLAPAGLQLCKPYWNQLSFLVLHKYLLFYEEWVTNTFECSLLDFCPFFFFFLFSIL